MGREYTFGISCALLAAPIAMAAPPVDEVNDAFGLRRSAVVQPAIIEALDGDRVVFVTVDGQPHVLHLEPHSIRADGYTLVRHDAVGHAEVVEPGPEHTYRGVLLDAPDSVVAATMVDDGLIARIIMPDGDSVWIEPVGDRVAGARAGDHVVYTTADVVAPDAVCAAGDLMRVQPRTDVLAGNGRAGAGVSTAELACEADFEYFQDHGGSVDDVEARITTVINAMNLQYEAEVNITHQITHISVWTAEQDPYSSTDAVTLLNQFRDYWNANNDGVCRDVAHMFTGKTVNGSTIGIAWLGAVCTDFGYGLVQSDFTGNFACVTDLSAHELGHNWGADHCRCSRPTAYTMNASITCANQFHPSRTIPDITAFRDTLNCLTPCGPDPVCGDGNCDPGETRCNCPADCGLPEATETDCSNGVDDDCDGDTDCADIDCDGDSACDNVAIVECITYTTAGGRNRDKNLNMTVLVVNSSGAPLGAATVSIALTDDSTTWTGTADTGNDGEVTFTLRNAGNACYSTDVTAITGGGATFDGTEPPNGFRKGTDATPDADCRDSNDPCG